MRHLRHVLLVCVLLTAGCRAERRPLYRIGFGTSPVAIDNPEPKDFIARYETVVPKALRMCGARFAGFDGTMSDGAEFAYFEIDGDSKAVTACVEHRLPQGKVVPVERTAEIDKLLEGEPAR